MPSEECGDRIEEEGERENKWLLEMGTASLRILRISLQGWVKELDENEGNMVPGTNLKVMSPSPCLSDPMRKGQSHPHRDSIRMMANSTKHFKHFLRVWCK